MGNYARVGVLCLMGLAIVVARLVEVEFRPGVQAPPVGPAMTVGAAPAQPAGAAAATAAGAAGAAGALAPTTAPAPPPATAPPQRVYVAKPGETLGAISKKVYGTSRKWKGIYDANRDVIKGPPESMRAGTQLKIPPP